MRSKIYSIDDFVNKCGHFYCADGCNCNNGYNCNHPEQEETNIDSDTEKTIGSCYVWSCPLAPEADKEDFEDPEVDNNGWTEWYESEFLLVEEAEKEAALK